MIPEVLEYIEEYMSKGLEYAKTFEKECDSKIKKILITIHNYQFCLLCNIIWNIDIFNINLTIFGFISKIL